MIFFHIRLYKFQKNHAIKNFDHHIITNIIASNHQFQNAQIDENILMGFNGQELDGFRNLY